MLELEIRRIKMTREEKKEYRKLDKAAGRIRKKYPFSPDAPEKSPFPELQALFIKASPKVLFYYYKQLFRSEHITSTGHVILTSLICGMASGAIVSEMGQMESAILMAVGMSIASFLFIFPFRQSGNTLVREKEAEMISEILHFEKYLTYSKNLAVDTDSELTQVERETVEGGNHTGIGHC